MNCLSSGACLRRSTVLVTALALDLALGEPPAAIHPVVWFGRLVALLERRARRGNPMLELVSGAGLALTALLIAWRGARGAEALLATARDNAATRVTMGLPRPAVCPQGRWATQPHWLAVHLIELTALLAEAWLLKTMLSLRALTEAATAVQQALVHDDLSAARAGLRSLVSRDSTTLEAPLLAAAAIESVAENASDALVAPALAYAAFGLPGAAVYRAINTLDAMVGYRGAYEWLGKAAARLDDAANLVPSRLTAVLLALAAGPGRRRSAWQVAWRDHRRTASPNAGWPMSAMAGALDVQLEKVDHYRLGAPARLPQADDIGKAICLLRRVAALTVAVVVACSFMTLLANSTSLRAGRENQGMNPLAETTKPLRGCAGHASEAGLDSPAGARVPACGCFQPDRLRSGPPRLASPTTSFMGRRTAGVPPEEVDR